MTMLTTQKQSTATTNPASHHTLDTLASCSLDELEALYRDASVSTTMRAADGRLLGRMLSVRGIPGPLGGPLRRWAASSSFLWEGKTFEASSDTCGVGHN